MFMNITKIKRALLACQIFVLIVLSGCAASQSGTTVPQTTSKMSIVESIQYGTPIDEVLKLLGEPMADVGSGTVVHHYVIDGQDVRISYVYNLDQIFCVEVIMVDDQVILQAPIIE